MSEAADVLAVWEGEGGACIEVEAPDRDSRLVRIRRSLQAKGREFLRGHWASLVALGAGLLVGGLLGRTRAR